MLTDEDLPEGWTVLHAPIRNGADLDALLGFDSNSVCSWDEIQNTVTGTRFLLRMAPPKVEGNRIVDDGAKVTAVIALPSESENRVTAADMRFPLGSIESAANLRRLDFTSGVGSMLAAMDYTPPTPVGRPDGTDAFYARVAELWRYFVDDDNPTERVREVNNVSLPTAQRWVTEARKRKMLPPGRRGRAK